MNVNATAATVAPYALPAGAGERLWIVGDTMTFKATAETAGGALTVIEVEAAPGGGPPPHVHEREDESFYVLAEILLGDTVVRSPRSTASESRTG